MVSGKKFLFNRIRFTTTHMEIGVHRHWWFQVQPWNRAKKRHMKARCYLFRATPTISLFSGLRSSLLRSDREVCAGTNLCWRYAHFSPTSEGSATSFSAREKWMVKETIPLKYSRFKVQILKAYGKSGAVQAAPAAPLPTALVTLTLKDFVALVFTLSGKERTYAPAAGRLLIF